MTSHSIFVLLGAFAVTLGLLALTLRLLGRVQMGGSTDRRSVALKVLNRVSIGPRQGVALLQVGERVLVVSMADSGTRLLTELDEADRVRALGTAPAPANTSRFSLMIPGLGRVALMLALALLPLMQSFEGAPNRRPVETAGPDRRGSAAPSACAAGHG